jgi:Ala-tRNA(Pro) deacylase
MALRKLKSFLDSERIKYQIISHSPAYTAQEIAATAHIPGKMPAKTVIVKLNGKMAMAVLPAHRLVNLQYLRDVTSCEDVQFAKEEEFRTIFPECEVGAMPPFGPLYGMDVYVAEELTQDRDIVFNACSHTELIRMSYEDFERLARPRVVSFVA